jgi:predicted XRE-type DNA-binding protein
VTNAVRIRKSSGNVFRDLGFSVEKAENLRIRADLMIQLTRLIEARGLTQAAAAKLMGVTQPRISDLVRGKIDRSSIDGLVEMLGHTGAQISFVVSRRRRVA